MFAPGHDEKLLRKVFDAGADAVLLDLEDAVPPSLKSRARSLVVDVLANRSCWVRVNRPTTDDCARDLEALGALAAGLRLPKVESAADVGWVAERAPEVPLDCTVESARGVAAVHEIARAKGCSSMSYGGLDLAADLGIPGGNLETLFARSSIVIAARAAGKPPPSDGVHALINDEVGLRQETEAARRLGFFGKSAIHPRQVPIINEIFTPSLDELAWANRVVTAFAASGGVPTTLSDGQFVDLPVAERARRLLQWRH